MTPLLILLSVLTNQLHEAKNYTEAKKAYIVIEEIEGIIKRTQGELPVKLPDELLSVAWCESGLKHEQNGKIVKSKTKDYGLMQISHQWFDEAQDMGLNVLKKEDNIKFAIYLYEKNGLRDWRASQRCWQRLAKL